MSKVVHDKNLRICVNRRYDYVTFVFARQEVESATTTTTTLKLRGTNRKMSCAHHILLWIVNAYHKA
ncbi:hypothetical protein V1478_010358 [Vespula squamosa]|uniref:Uncharacterized protein n=1 Tax=Vespula squamosa TaxID=30214 RepID=A0ABD2AHJ5_VESSQ